MFTQEELRNLLALIGIAPIKGSEATTVALLQQKITALVSNEVPSVQPAKSEKDAKPK